MRFLLSESMPRLLWPQRFAIRSRYPEAMHPSHDTLLSCFRDVATNRLLRWPDANASLKLGRLLASNAERTGQHRW
jgi:hypothetical protein